MSLENNVNGFREFLKFLNFLFVPGSFVKFYRVMEKEKAGGRIKDNLRRIGYYTASLVAEGVRIGGYYSIYEITQKIIERVS